MAMDACTGQAETDAQGPSLDWRLLPLLPDYMNPETWLICFQASSTMAHWVLQHATHTHLKLHLLGSDPATASGGTNRVAAATSGSRYRGASSREGLVGPSSTTAADGNNRVVGARTGDESNSGSRGGSSRGGSSSQGHVSPNVQVAQRLASQAGDVALTLHGGLLTPTEYLRSSITSIRLQHVQLPDSDVVASTLQLHALPRLHTLGLVECRVESTGCSYQQGSSSKGGSYQPAASVRTLVCMNSTVPAHQHTFPPAIKCLPLALSLVDPGQLQTVTTNEATVVGHMHHMTALQELNLSSNGSYREQQRVSQAVEEDGLLARPGLKRLSVEWLSLDDDCSEQPCTLDSLHLLGGAGTALLARLPLATGLKSLTVKSRLWINIPLRTDLGQAVSNLHLHLFFHECAHLAFVPAGAGQCSWQPWQPTFQLNLRVADRQVPGRESEVPEDAQLVALCLKGITASGTAFILAKARLTPAVLASLVAALPPTTTTVCFDMCQAPPAAAAAPAVAVAPVAAPVQPPPLGVISNLPAHINQVVLIYDGGDAHYWTANILPRYLQGVERTLRLTLLVHVYRYNSEGWQQRGLGRCSHVWQEGDKAEVRRWLSEHSSSQVQVDFQDTVAG